MGHGRYPCQLQKSHAGPVVTPKAVDLVGKLERGSRLTRFFSPVPHLKDDATAIQITLQHHSYFDSSTSDKAL
jgi:hypothetical protein